MNVEYKVTVEGPAIDAVANAMKLGEPERREVALFDTPGRELYAKGAVLRARRVHDGGGDDTTAKARGVDAAKIDAGLAKKPGFKIEIDRTPSESETAASLTDDVPGHVIKRVFSGKDAPLSLFDADQQALLGVVGVHPVPWDRIRAFGPIAARVWKKLRAPGLPLEATVEDWDIPGRRLLEISTRVDEKDAAGAALTMKAFLDHLGLDAKATVSKTKALLDAFALVLVVVVGATGCYQDGHPAGDSCQFDNAEAVPNEGWTHVNDASELIYKHNPPASGPHFPVWAGWEVHDDVVNRGNWVHNLEHGGIVLLIGTDASDAEKKVINDGFTAIADDPECHHRRALVTQDPELDVHIAVVAADTVLEANLTPDVIKDFAATCENHGPEDICY